jgi:hypothetical protein
MSSFETPTQNANSGSLVSYQDMSNAELQICFQEIVKEVSKRLESDDSFEPFPTQCSVTINQVMLAVTDMLYAVDVQVFELSMWQAFTGRTAARKLRHFEPEEEMGAEG